MGAKSKGLALTALALVPFLMVLGNSMLVPVLPELKSEMQVSKTSSALVITAFSVAAGIAIVAAGYLADRFGRKPVIIPAVLIYGLGGLISGIAAVTLKDQGFGLLMGARILQGIGAAGTAPVAMAMAADLFKKERTQAMGVIEAANGMGKVVSPVAGAAIGLLAWWLPFFVYAAISVPTAAAVAFWTQEPARPAAKVAEKPDVYVGKVMQVFKKQKGAGLGACFFAGTTLLMILFGVLFYLSDYLEHELGLAGIVKGLILASPVLLLCGTAFLGGRYLQVHMDQLRHAVLLGIVLETAGTLLVAILPRASWALFSGIAVGSVGAGMVLPAINSLVTGASEVSVRGMVTALYSSIRFLGVAAGPPLFGWMVEIRRSLPFWFSVGLLAIGGILAYSYLYPKHILGEDALSYPLPGQLVPASRKVWELPTKLPVGTRRAMLGRPPEKSDE